MVIIIMKNIKILDLGLKFTEITEVGDLDIDFKVTEVQVCIEQNFGPVSNMNPSTN